MDSTQLINSLLAAAERSINADPSAHSSDEDENRSQSSSSSCDEDEDRVMHLTCGFVRMLKQSANEILEFRQVANELQCEMQVVQDISSVLESCQLVKRIAINKIQWCAPFDVLRLPSQPLRLPITMEDEEEDFVAISQLESENKWLDSMLTTVRLDSTQLAASTFIHVDDFNNQSHALIIQTNSLATNTSIQVFPHGFHIDSDRALKLFELSERRELKRIKMDSTTIERNEETVCVDVAQLFPSIPKEDHASPLQSMTTPIGSQDNEDPIISSSSDDDEDL